MIERSEFHDPSETKGAIMKNKKIITSLCAAAVLIYTVPQNSTCSETLAVGDVTGQTVATDIVTSVNGSSIPAYSTNGETLVRIADLAYYGFDVEFRNGVSCADYNENKAVTPITREQQPGLPILYTDIEVQINGVPVPGYNIDGYMAVPVERMCETYLQTNARDIYSPYDINYIWSEHEKALYIDVSSDRVPYQDLMLRLLSAAKMDRGSAFYDHYVRDTERELSDIYDQKFSDIADTDLEDNIYLLSKADLIDINSYEDGDLIHPYRGSTMTDAAFLISRILGCPVSHQDVIEYFQSLYTDDAGSIAGQNIKIEPDYRNSEINASDAAFIPTWARPYFAYLLDIGVFKTDGANCINPNEFLTAESEEALIGSMLSYMERGVTDMDIDFILYPIYYNTGDPITKTPHKLTSPAQIIDNILYIPWYSVFNSSYAADIQNAGAIPYCAAHKFIAGTENIKLFNNCLTTIFNDQYTYIGGFGYVFNVFPGMDGYIYQMSNQARGGNYVPYFIKTEYPILKLYGEPMLPIYDYSTKQNLTETPAEDPDNILKLNTGLSINFDPMTDIIQMRYCESQFNGS